MIVAWLAFPALLAVLSLGAGLVVERLSGRRLPGVVLIGLGAAALIVAGLPATLWDATAPLAVPCMVALAAGGLTLAPSRDWGRFDGWAAGCALAVFAAFAAPFVLSGEPTIGGYIRLDDSASWIALAQRATVHGREYALAPSTYEAMVDFYLGSDYPLGGLLPLGAGRELLGQDTAWLWQPWLTALATLLALSLYAIAGRIVRPRPLRALAAFVAAQPALLFGYALWGGFKELAGAWLLALVAWLVVEAVRRTTRDGLDARAWGAAVRRLLPLAVACAATLGVLSVGGALWLAPFAICAAIALARAAGARAALRDAALAVGLVALLSIPALAGLDFLGAPAASTITNQSRLANLIEPLSPLQIFGVWPAGDFRLRAGHGALVGVLITIVAVAAVAGLVACWRRRAPALPLYVGALLAATVAVLAAGSPWVGAKALAMASPAVVLAAMVGAGSLATARPRRPLPAAAALACGVAIAGGVLWSNVLGYGDVSLAPHARFAELQRIGERIAGEGPTLMTDYAPYGARYFLRDGDPESASELRRRRIPLRDGRLLRKGSSAEIGAFALPGVLTYRTLVLRRSPFASRPPAPYRLVFSGRYYDVWRRPASATLPIADIGLGGPRRVAAVPRCDDVAALARRAPRLAYAPGPATQPVTVDLARATGLPAAGGDPGAVLAGDRAATIRTTVALARSGRYELWLGGSFRGEVTIAVDGRRVLRRHGELAYEPAYVSFGTLALARGRHTIAVHVPGPGLSPGSAGPPLALGPLVLTRSARPSAVSTVAASRARSLCGRRLDWIEALPR